MKRLMMFIAVLAMVISVMPAQAEKEIEEAPLTWQQASLDDGGALYAELCAVCHGAGGTGDGPAAPALSDPLPDLTMLAAHNDGVFPADGVEKVIAGDKRVVAHGTVEMPVWGRAFEDLRPYHKPARRWAFSRSRVYNLTEYLKTIQVVE